MTPERAREIALTCFVDGKALGCVSDAVIADRILKACAEQRESDAKICEKVRTEYAGRGGWTGANACYIQIRREK